MSWKKWIVALATVVTTTSFAPASAADCYDCDTGSDCGFSLCDCDPCEGWSVYADYLYWTVRRCDLDYAFSYDGTINGLYSVCPSYDSGFRIGVLKACGDVDFGVHYTYFKGKDSAYVTNENNSIGQTRLNPGTFQIADGDIELATAGYSVELNQLDLELGYHLEVSDCLAARLFTGFRFANIKQDLATIYSEDLNDPLGESTANEAEFGYFRTEIDFYGLYLGNKASYKVSDCFDFFGGFSLGIGVGEVEQKYAHLYQPGGQAELDERDYFSGNCWKAMGVLDLNLGVTFPLCNVCCTDWALSFGYEFHHWFNASDFASVTRDMDGADFSAGCCDLGFDGLFVRLSAAF